MGKIKKTLFLGGVMGAGLIWLTSTKKGKEVRDQLLDQAATIYDDVKTKIVNSKLAEKISKSEYTKMVTTAVERYGREHKILAPLKALIVQMILAQWDSVREDVERMKKPVKETKRKILGRRSKTA